MTKEGIIDATPLNLSCGDKAYISNKPVEVKKGRHLEVVPIDRKKFSIWHDVNGCGEFTLALTPFKSDRQAKKVMKQIIRNEEDLIFWQGELLWHFNEVSLIDVIHYAKKYHALKGLILNHLGENRAQIVPYGDSCKKSIVEVLQQILEENEK